MKHVIEKLSLKYNIPEPILKKIVHSPFKYTAEVMAEGEFKPVRHPYFGVFAVKPGRLEKLNKKKE